MKIIGISGSPRDKNTNYMLRTVLDATGRDYELIVLKDKNVNPCNACGGCYQSHKCIIKDDMQEIYDKLLKADIIVLGSPTYFDNVSSYMKVFMDRCLPLYFSKVLKNKKVGLVTVGNFKKDEVRWLDDFSPVPIEEIQKTVQKCINNMENFCNQLELKIIGKVYASNSNPEAKKDELIQLGKRLIS